MGLPSSQGICQGVRPVRLDLLQVVDATRLAILEMLRGGERCVCDLQADLDAAQSKLSFHLKVLKDAGLVTDRREGRWSYYEIVPQALAEVHDLAVGLQPKKGTLRVLQPGSCCD